MYKKGLESHKWQIQRHGEEILWGKGALYLQYQGFKKDGYRLFRRILDKKEREKLEDNFNYYLLVENYTENHKDLLKSSNIVGLSVGQVNRKMIKKKTADFTAIKIK